MKIDDKSQSKNWVVPVHAIYLAQDDRKKNTAVRLSRKNKIKCITEMIKCKYSARKNIRSIGPLYSVEYPATTSDSVSAWSKGALFDSKNKTTINPDAAGA